MLADERTVLRQTLKLTVEEHVRVGKLPPSLRREGEERAGAAFDIDPAVLAGSAGQIVEFVQLFLARHDGEAERLDDARSLVECQLAQRRAADFPGVAKHAAEIETA